MKKDDLIAVLGFGSQGKAIACNLHDSGFEIIIGLRKGSRSIKEASKNDLKTAVISDAIRLARVIIIAIPDHVHRQVLIEEFFDKCRENCCLVFLHGSSIHFKQVVPPKKMPVLLLAPHAPGVAVRENYLKKRPFSAFYGVHQGRRKQGFELLIKLAGGIGLSSNNLVKTTFGDEAIGDLFGEQAILCGGLARMLKFGFETLVEAGIPSRNAYLEVAYQLDLIVDLVKQHGLKGMLERISPMARYGSVVNGPRVIPSRVKADMKKVLSEIKSGKFLDKADKSGLELEQELLDQLTNRLFDRQVKKFKK